MFLHIHENNTYSFRSTGVDERPYRIFGKYAASTVHIFLTCDLWPDIPFRNYRKYEYEAHGALLADRLDEIVDTPTPSLCDTLYKELINCPDCLLLDSFGMSDKGFCDAPVIHPPPRISDMCDCHDLRQMPVDRSNLGHDNQHNRQAMFRYSRHWNTLMFFAIPRDTQQNKSYVPLHDWAIYETFCHRYHKAIQHDYIEGDPIPLDKFSCTHYTMPCMKAQG